MSTYQPRIQAPNLISWSRYCRNGQVANGLLARRIAEQTNHIIGYRRKVWMVKPMIAASIPASQSGTNDWFYFAGHTGHGVDRLECHLVMAKADDEATSDPYVDFQITDGISGGSTLTSDEAHYGDPSGSTPDDEPDEFHSTILTIDGISSDQLYRGAVRTHDYARIAAAMIVEVGDWPVDTTDGAVDPGLGVASPILDANLSNVLESLSDVWQHNAGTVLQWSRDNDANSQIFKTGDPYENIWDDSTSVSSSSVGMRVDLQYRNTVAQDEVPVKMVVRAVETVSNVGTSDNKLKISDGTNEIEIANIDGSTLWYQTTGTMPATDGQKWDIMARAGAGGLNPDNSIRVDCVYVFEYQA